MQIKNIYKRIVTTLTWPILIFFLVYKWTVYNNLPFTIIASYEMQNMIYGKTDDQKAKPLIPFYLPSVLIIAAYLEYTIFPGISLVQIALMSMIVVTFFIEVIKGAEEKEPFSQSIQKIAYTVLLIVYPTYICTFPIMLINISPQGPLYILMLFTLVFGNDISCYVFGMLFGATSRGVFKVSPNKSVVGYLGGLIVTPVLSYFFVTLVPGMPEFSRFWCIILGVLIAITSDVGDLIESAFKRAGKVKDSGVIIWGRGGVLDSFDSFLNSAPIFCLWLLQWSYGILQV